jgi:hypothetical protein
LYPALRAGLDKRFQQALDVGCLRASGGISRGDWLQFFGRCFQKTGAWKE